jgi:putative aldouronate transport system substrate-binding protein
MQKRTKSILTMLLAVLILAVSFTGCANTTQTPAKPITAPTTGTSTAEPEKQKELVTLTAFIMQSVSSNFGLEEDWMAEIMKDELKIQIEFAPTGDAVEQKLQAMMASGDLTDIVGFKEHKQGIAAVDAKMLLNLEEYKDIMPNIFDNDMMKYAVKYSRNELSSGSGNMYIIPTAVGPLGATKDTNWKPMLMWDQYKQVGMPEINTLEDYLTVTKQMQDIYPVNEAGEKVYGFTLFSDWDSLTALQVSTLSFLYGIDTEYVSPLMEAHVTNHTINSVLDEDSFYKRALKFYFQANQMGLLDPDSLTQTFDTVQEKRSAGRVLFSYFSWLTGQFNSRGSGYVDAENPNGYEFIPAKDMKIYDAPHQYIGRAWSFAISANTKYPDRAAELLNWLYHPDTYSLFSNGPEGLLWEFDANGEPYVTDKGWEILDNIKTAEMPLPGGGKLEEPAFQWNTLGYTAATIHPAHGYPIVYRNWPSTLRRNPTKLVEEWREWSGSDTQIEYMKKHNMISPATQAINMVPAPNDDLQMKLNQIGDVVKTNSWVMIFAENEAEFESKWEEMVRKAEGLGMQEVVDYYTDAWEKALERVSQYED